MLCNSRMQSCWHILSPFFINHASSVSYFSALSRNGSEDFIVKFHTWLKYIHHCWFIFISDRHGKSSKDLIVNKCTQAIAIVVGMFQCFSFNRKASIFWFFCTWHGVICVRNVTKVKNCSIARQQQLLLIASQFQCGIHSWRKYHVSSWLS